MVPSDRTGPLALPGGATAADDGAMTEQPHSCPYCELQFAYHEEVRDHILRDHPDHSHVAATVEIHELPHS
jgi:hypothetical protein